MPCNSALTIPGRLGKNTKVPSGTPCLIDTAAVSNLLQGIWIQQPLLAAEIHEVEHLPWDYGVEFQHQGDKIEVAFQPIPLADIMANVRSVHDEPGTKPSA